MAKQELSPKASAAKKRRDIATAKTPLRKARKAENQRIGQSPNRDLHHKSDGSVVKVSIKNNRGNFGKGTKTENMKQPFKMKHTDGKKASPAKFFKSMMGGLSRIPGAGGLLGMARDEMKTGKLGLEEKLRSTLNKRAEEKAEETIDKVVNNESEEGLV